MPKSELTSKTIGLYFGAYWSLPCFAFIVQLTNSYNNLKAVKDDCFEIVLISINRDLEECRQRIKLNVLMMPKGYMFLKALFKTKKSKIFKMDDQDSL